MAAVDAVKKGPVTVVVSVVAAALFGTGDLSVLDEETPYRRGKSATHHAPLLGGQIQGS